MLSRVADSVYWISRYIERVENIARFVDVNLNLSLDVPQESVSQWRPLVATTGDLDDFEARYRKYNDANVIRFLTFDQDNPNSIISCLRQARENARTVRETISSEMWEQINKFYLMVRSAAAQSNPLESPHAFFTEIKMGSHLFVGLQYTTMSHGEAWHFARMGRVLERADKTARIVDVKYFMLLPNVEYVGTPYDTLLWTALLKSASAFEMYRKKYRRIDSRRVVDFLVLDREFPRSIRRCLNIAEDSMRQITGSDEGVYVNAAERSLARLSSELDYADVEEIVSAGLHQYLDNLQLRLNGIGKGVFDEFFSLYPVRRSETVGAAQD